MPDLGIASLHGSSLHDWLGRVLPQPAPVLLAASGGLDSSVLWYLLQEAGLPYAVAHVDYRLRGAESTADAASVFAKAKSLNVRFHQLQAGEKPHGTNLQGWARDLRYAYFKRLRKEYGYAKVLTAQHADDHLESMLIALLRGGNLDRFAGMEPVGPSVLRPLLRFSRKDLSAYAKTHHISYREDRSNASDAYLRNRLRHHVVPALKQEAPNVLEHAQTLGFNLRRLLHSHQEQTQEVLLAATQNGEGLILDHQKLSESRDVSVLVGQRLRHLRFSTDVVERFAEQLQHPKVGRLHFFNGDRSLQLVSTTRHSYLHQVRQFPSFQRTLSLPSGEANSPLGKLAWSEAVPNGEDLAYAFTLYLSPSAKLYWRTAKPSDRIALSQGGTKALRRVLAEAHYPNAEGASVLVQHDLVCGVVGIRMGHQAPTDEQLTTHFTFRPNPAAQPWLSWIAGPV